MKISVEYTAVHVLELEVPDGLDEKSAHFEALNQYKKRQINSNGVMSRFPLKIFSPIPAISAA